LPVQSPEDTRDLWGRRAQRLRQPWCERVAGLYHICGPERFAVGHKHVVCRVLYRNDHELGLAAFMECLLILAPALADFVSLMRFRLTPLACRTRLRRGRNVALVLDLSCS
jgi:hypothetical protein